MEDDTTRDLDKALDTIRAICTTKATEALAKEEVEKILSDHQLKLKLFMAAFSLKRVNSIIRVAKMQDFIEEKLLDPERWKNASNKDLLKLLVKLNDIVAQNMDYFSQILGGDTQFDPNLLVVLLGDKSKAEDKEKTVKRLEDLSPESREKIRSKFSDLLGSLKNDG